MRDIVGETISDTIDTHRASRRATDTNYVVPVGFPTDQEITDFICTNQLLDPEIIEFLTEPDFLGFESRVDSVRAEWLQEFRDNVGSWAETMTWHGADLIDIGQLLTVVLPKPSKSMVWRPALKPVRPRWIETSPTALMLAADLLKKGRLLSELNWRTFEKLIATLLEKSGWTVELTRGSKDGGIDVVAIRDDPLYGGVKSLWQAKKYDLRNKVQLRDVRELSAIRDDQKATKASIVTTSHLTRGAIDWIRRDEFRLGYKDRDAMEKWVIDSLEK